MVVFTRTFCRIDTRASQRPRGPRIYPLFASYFPRRRISPNRCPNGDAHPDQHSADRSRDLAAHSDSPPCNTNGRCNSHGYNGTGRHTNPQRNRNTKPDANRHKHSNQYPHRHSNINGNVNRNHNANRNLCRLSRYYLILCRRARP